MNGSKSESLKQSSGGFTLIELIIAMAVIGVLVAMAVPSMRDLSFGSSATSTNNRLLTSLNTARIEAVKNATNVRVSAVGGNWTTGWEVAVDINMNGVLDGEDRLIQAAGALPKNFEMRAVSIPGGALTEVFYTSTGELSTPNSGVWFKLERPDNASYPERCKRLRIDPSGRAQTEKGNASLCSA